MLSGLGTILATHVKFADTKGDELVAGCVVKKLGGAAIAGAGRDASLSLKDIHKGLALAAEI